jgi:UDP-N-acetylglucosamine 4,6-dehydratase
MLDGKYELVTGATVSFGRRVIPTVLKRHNHRRVGLFSRDELKQFEMQSEFTDERFVVGLLITLAETEMARLRADLRFEVS